MAMIMLRAEFTRKEFCMLDNHIPLQEAARKLSCSEDTVRRMIKSGRLPALRLGNHIRISERDIIKSLQVHPQEYIKVKSPRKSMQK